MKKGMRFQTKLMITMVFMITVVTLALLTATERKIRQAYTRQFERDFKSMIDQLDESRTLRSKEFRALSTQLAKSSYIIGLLRGDQSNADEMTFWSDYRDAVRSLEGGAEFALPMGGRKMTPGALSEQIANRVGMVATMDLNGEVTVLTPPPLGNSNTGDKRTRWKRFNYNEAGARGELEKFIRQGEQQILYLAVPGKNGEPQPQNGKNKGKGAKLAQSLAPKDNAPLVQEMISTPVTDPDSGEILGLFLRGTSAETEAHRFLERYQSAMGSEEVLKNGIYLDGQIYSRAIEPTFATELAAAVQETIDETTDISRLRYEGDIGGLPYAVYIDPLSDTPTPRPAYEVAAFPLAGLQADLAELRIRGSGIGAGVMLFGIIIAYLMARNLSVPLKELAIGTEAIRAGSLDHRVGVTSHDEIGELAQSFNEMAEDLKQKDLYRELLGKVSDETVAQALISGSLDLELGGELKHVSVLFCDIRGFTALTEHMNPTDVIELVNTHMTAMTQIVRSHFGVVDKFVGDEIMAVFGGLKSYGNDAANAAACALEMIETRNRLNASIDVPIEVGIGVATGEAVAGCMGSSDRLNFTVLGARVNLAARLCSVAETNRVVIDRNTLDSLGDRAVVDPLPDLQLKGFTDTWSAFTLKQLRDTPGSPADPVLPAGEPVS